jgi:hypothetical protein
MARHRVINDSITVLNNTGREFIVVIDDNAPGKSRHPDMGGNIIEAFGDGLSGHGRSSHFPIPPELTGPGEITLVGMGTTCDAHTVLG